MPKVTLGRHWNPGDKHYGPGAQVTVSEDVKAWLTRTGAIEQPARKSTRKAKVTENTAPEVEPDQGADEQTSNDVEGTDDEATDPLEGVDDTDERPARAASIDEWRTYAEANGLATKGMSKQEIIAAIG